MASEYGPCPSCGRGHYGPCAPTPHGTYGGYTNHACRCSACREAARAYRATYRERHPERDKRTGRLLAAAR